jgi:tRNA A-37 threonylcarbamoyl transferase component Bud32
MYTKKNVKYEEFKIHKLVSEQISTINTPKIHNYDKLKNTLTMEEILEMNISDMYGEEAKDVPSYIFDKIRKIIIELNENNIDYPDITGYNFIEYKEKIYIIDFGDAKIIKSKDLASPFVKDFINGLNKWNPEFK